nr:MAG TPA: hypothetical protein [Caudoviricetes sp.]
MLISHFLRDFYSTRIFTYQFLLVYLQSNKKLYL